MTDDPSPYADAWAVSLERGWRPIPLPPRAKQPPPGGYTGPGGVEPTPEQLFAWLQYNPYGNLLVHLGPDEIGIDVDDYGDKPGGDTLRSLIEQYGPLPPTWRISARLDDEGESGILLFRLPAGVDSSTFRGGWAGIEVLRHSHRYVVSPPSIHPTTGTAYETLDQRTGERSDRLPPRAELPELPAAWLPALQRPERAERSYAPTTRVHVPQLGGVDPCPAMLRALSTATAGLSSHEARHDVATREALNLVRLDDQGHHGGGYAIHAFGLDFVESITPDRVGGHGEAVREWDSILRSAEAIVESSPTPPGDRGCCGEDSIGGQITAAAAEADQWIMTLPDVDAAWEPFGEPDVLAVAAEVAHDDAELLERLQDAPTAAELDEQPVADPEPPADPLGPARAFLRGLDDEMRTAVRQLWTAREARRHLLTLTELEHPRPEPDIGTVAELLTREPEPPWRVAGLLPAGGRLLLVAMRKTGKTTTVANLTRSLLSGEPFLDAYSTQPLEAGRTVVVLNYEVTGRTFAGWLHDVGVDEHRVHVVNLRGRRNLLADDAGRAQLVELIRSVNGGVLVVDPFGRAYTGADQNSASEVGPWLVQLDEVAEAAGVDEVVLTVHAGWNGERTRGSSALEDWPDSIVTLTRDQESDDGVRFLKAEGRDVDVAETALTYDVATRHLSVGEGGSRSAHAARAKLEKLGPAVIDVLTAAWPNALSGAELTKRMKDGGAACPAANSGHLAASLLAEKGLVTIGPGLNGGHLHSLSGAPVPTSEAKRPKPLVATPENGFGASEADTGT